jgi:hypothetical protein
MSISYYALINIEKNIQINEQYSAKWVELQSA